MGLRILECRLDAALRSWRTWGAGCVAILALAARAGEVASPVVGYVEGRVMVRAPGQSLVGFPSTGQTLVPGGALITGDQACIELRVGESGLWRVGRRAVVMPRADGGRLMAGAALVRVPGGAGWRIESARGAVRLGQGLWMLQAVDNEGLKLVCLDGPAQVEALGDGTAAKLTLRPGELVFLRPGGAGFGPVVVIYLEELLATSRLVNGFPEPLPEMRRLRNLGVVQREQLKSVTNALVAGARSDDAFEVAVPRAAPASEPAK